MELPGPLVSSAWLAEHLGRVVVADVRWEREGSARASFETGHIPTAVFLDADDDLSAIGSGPGRHPLPSADAFAATMGDVGIDDDTLVVAYDDAGGSHAARLWWMLDATGHAVALLDGGLGAWSRAREAGPGRTPSPAWFTARPWPDARLADADAVAAMLEGGWTLVLDARAGERYRGELEPIDPVAGHIPGARSAPWGDNLDAATGRFRSAAELRARYEALGVDRADDVVVYCGSGLTAAHDLLAMRVAGMERDGRLYAGSWSGWIEDLSHPVATGDA